MKAYIDIDIGNIQQFEQQQNQQQIGLGYFLACKNQLAIDKEFKHLSAEDIEILQDSFEANPQWSQKGLARFQEPDNIRAGRLTIELFQKECPKTVENFKCLLTGEKGLGKQSKKALYYKGCHFHRVVQGFVCQGGDIVRGDGSGGDSIYGGKFNDEKAGLKLKHDKAGVLSMANSGQKNTNTSQFYITLNKASQCDGKHVVFGQVVEGLEVLTQIDSQVASKDGTPKVSCRIADCGILEY